MRRTLLCVGPVSGDVAEPVGVPKRAGSVWAASGVPGADSGHHASAAGGGHHVWCPGLQLRTPVQALA